MRKEGRSGEGRTEGRGGEEREGKINGKEERARQERRGEMSLGATVQRQLSTSGSAFALSPHLCRSAGHSL